MIRMYLNTNRLIEKAGLRQSFSQTIPVRQMYNVKTVQDSQLKRAYHIPNLPRGAENNLCKIKTRL